MQHKPAVGYSIGIRLVFAPLSRYGAGMRMLTALMVVAAVTGCAEVVQGPRRVDYAEDRFYIRHAPFTGAGEIDKQAQDRCEATGKAAALRREAQYYFVDLRDADYVCQ